MPNLQEIYCTAAETEGDNSDVDKWPSSFFVRIIHQRPLLAEFQNWVKTQMPPMCIFMPDRVADATVGLNNQVLFEALVRTLSETQSIAVLPWNMPNIRGAGIVLFPSNASRTILIGAVFLQTNFPDFVHSALQVSPSRSNGVGLIPRHMPFNPALGNSTSELTLPSIARHSHGGGSQRTG